MSLWRLFTSVEGRIPRRTYWLGILGITAIGLPVIVIVALIGGGTAGAIANLFFLWCGFALSVKRAQDRDRHYLFVAAYFAFLALVSGLSPTQSRTMEDMAADYQPLFFIASALFVLYVLFLFVELGLRRGTLGPNRYGPDPLEAAAEPMQSRA